MTLDIHYSATVTALCPENNGRDVYNVDITTHEAIWVERIETVLNSFTDEHYRQEELTAAIAQQLGGTVRTEGLHGRVSTVVKAHEEP